MDEHLYMDIAVGFYRILQHPTFQIFGQMNQYMVDHPPFRPPLYPLPMTFLFFIFGLQNSYKLGLLLNGLYYITTVLALYYLARCFLSKTASVIASFLYATYGWVLFYLHFTYSETATTTFVVLSTLFLVRSNFFKKTKEAFLFGLFLSFGLLIRWVVPLFVAGPLFFSLYKVITVPSLRKNKIIIKNIILSFIPLILPLLFYAINNKSFGSYFFSQFFHGPLWELVPSGRKSFFSYGSFVYYIKVLEQLTIFPFLLFIAGLISTFLYRRKWGLLFLAFLIPYLIFSFGTVIKDDRYIIPIYPFIALISAAFFDLKMDKLLKYFLILLVFVIGIGNFLGASWGIGPMGKKGLESFLLPMPLGHPRTVHVAPVVWPPTRNFSNADKIINIIEEDSNLSKNKDLKVLILFGYHPLDDALYSINKYEKFKPFMFNILVGSEIKNPILASNLIKEEFRSSDYFLYKTGNIADNYFPPNNYVLIKFLNDTFKSTHLTIFKDLNKIAEVDIPIDGSKVFIYKREKAFREEDLEEFSQRFIDQVLSSNKINN